MLESIVASTLNQVLGDYVDNLETKQLNIGIWSGNVILNNLKLRREALDKFNLPIDITEGYLGRLTLSIPWSDLTNKPVHISIDQVYLIAKPKADTAYDEVLEDERAQKLKQDRLATAEMVVDASSGPATKQEDQSFLTQLTQKIVDNIQVQIKNIHVRFEDSVSSKTPFAVGITLSELSITSTNTEWVPAFIQSENGLVHKLMKLEQLAVYWNTKLESLEGYDQKTAMLYFLSQISHKDDLTQHQYILKPVSGVGKLKMHKKYVPGKPLYDADIEFDKLAFNLDDDQYHCLLALLASFSLYIKSQKYRSLRPPPGVRPKDNPRAWLEYAGQSVLREVHEKHRKMTWAYFEERRDDRKEYIEHYKKMRIGSITADERIRLSDLERKLDYTDIKFYRTIARSQLKKEQSLAVKPVVVDQESAPTPAAASQTWVGWLFGASATEAKAEEAPQLTEIDMEQIKETIEFDPEMTLPSDLPNDAVYCKIKWQLESGSFTLLRNDEKIRQELISVAFQKLAASLVAYPKSYLGEMKVQDMTSTDNTTPDNLYSSIIKRSPRADTEQPFFNMKFELNPLDERADKAIEIRMLPLEVVYNPVAISALVSFFTPPEEDIDTANTLLAVAQDTLQGMASQTRAGLEYLLETRQTLELKVDLEAPYLFVPENCTDKNGYVLLVNMGHLYVESDLVSKEKKKQLQAKQGTKLSPKDLETLRSLLYDRFKCQLNDVQFLVGVSAEDCRAHAQNSLCSDVHFVERVDMEFCFESCIIPGQNDLPQTKISGKLPRLHLNFSDRKYKVVMRLLDTIFGAKPQSKTSSRSVSLLNIKPMSIDWRALSSDNMVEEEFFDAEEMPSEATGANQPDRKLIDFQFEITHASASVKKSNVNRNLEDQPLADLVIKGLSLKFVSRPFDMNLDVNIKELLIEDKLQPQSSPFPNLLSTSKREQDGFIEHFVAVSYASVNPSSPYYKGESQIVRIDFASADFVLTRSSVLSLYDYILTTFAGNNRSPSSESLGPSKSEVVPDLSAITSGLEEVARRTTSQTGALIVKIRVKGFNVIMNQDERRLASIYFGSGLLAVTLKDNELAVKGQLGKMSVFDDLEHPDPHYPYRQLLSIEGDQVADFAYQTYSPSSPTYPGHDQYLRLRTGSLKLTFVEASLNGILAYLQEFQRMHVYETARKAAIETAVKQMETVGRFCYDVQIQTPIVILPDVTFKTRDTVTMYLGAISAKNSYTEALPGTIANQLVASVSSMRLESSFIYAEHAPQVLPIIDNVTISINLDSLTSTNKRVPDNSICVDVSEVKLRLTTQQYEFLLDLSTSVMRFLGSVSGSAPDQQLSANDRSVPAADGSETNRNASAKASLEAVVKMPSLFLEIFHDTDYSRPAAVSQTTLARFSVDQLSLQYATKADSSMAVELRVKSISLEDTRPDSQSLFRNVIPVSAADKDVLLVSYEVSSAGQKNVLVTVDSPKFILALDHLFAMRSFAVAPKSLSASSAVEKAEAEAETEAAAIAEVPDQGQSLTYRIALVDMEMTLVQDPTVAHSEAILLCGKHLVLSYDTVLVLSVKELGMFFCAMDKRAETTLRFIQNFDLALNMDERITSPGHKMTNLMINVTPLILRVSYKDMALITDISNTFTKLSTQSTGAKALDAPVVRPTTPTTPHYIMCRERLQLITQGFHLVLIDDLTDLHLPMFDASFDDVYVELFDWSSMPRLDAGLLLKVNYFNLKNSHWEPLVEPWQCSLHVMHPESKHLSVEFVSRKKLDVNISHVFCETVMSTMALLKKNQDRNLATRRDIHAPYLLRNRTGYSIFIWSEAQADTSGTQIHTLGNNDDMPWRFEEWRATRESTMPVPNKLSVQINGPSWESLKNITVDTEGVVTYLLRPMINQITHRFVCDVRLKDNIKIVTFRSVTVVQNETNLPLELMVVNSKKQMTSGIYNMEPGQECFIPIEASYCDSIMIRPHEGFGYKWSTERLYWRDLQRDRFFPLVECPSYDVSTPVFRFQVNTIFHSRSSGYPMMTIKLLPPFLLENLLPYNFKYVIVDKHGQQEHRDQLTRGEAAYIHTVNPTHVLVLAIEIPGTPYGRSEVAVICHSDTSFRDETLQLSDADGRQLRLRIKYSDKPERGGRKVTIYSPYVLINQTGLDLIFSSRSLMSSSGKLASGQGAFVGQKKDKVEPLMFSYSSYDHPSQTQIKVGNSEWSKRISFEAVGSSFDVGIPLQNQGQIHIGVNVKEGEGKYFLTKVVTLTPRYMIKNNLSEELHFKQVGTDVSQVLQPGVAFPLTTIISSGRNPHLTVRLGGIMNTWSSPFSINLIGRIHVKLGLAGSEAEDLIRADIIVEGATVFVVFAKETGRWPFRIDNQCSCNVAIWQQHKDDTTSRIYRIPAGKSLSYAWDYPSAENKSLILHVNGREQAIDLLEVGQIVPIRYMDPNEKKSATMAISVNAEGPTQILRLTPYIEERSHFRRGKRSSEKERALTESEKDGFELIDVDEKVVATYLVRLEGIGISLISKGMQELIYASAKDVRLEFQETKTLQRVNFTVKWLQVDNQLYGGIVPILLYPTVIPKEGSENFYPVLLITLSKSKDTSYGLEYYNWFSILLQEFSFEADEDILYAIVEFSKFQVAGWDVPALSVDQVFDTTLELPKSTLADDDTRMYFEKFLLQPIKINISFSRTQAVNREEPVIKSGGVLTFMIDVLTTYIANWHDAPWQFNALELSHPIVTPSQLVDLIVRFYTEEAVGQLWRTALGSADFLGNPIGLFNNVSSGVSDMFYEPLQGFEITRPQDLGINFAKGTASLVKKTVYGLSDTVSRVTGSVSKGIARITLDEEFQARRRIHHARNRPKHAVSGISTGALSLASSVVSGVTGVVSKPLEGAEKSGVGGFFMGLGVGLVGVVTKPVVGAFDLLSDVSQGIKNTATSETELERQRLPRLIGKDRILKPYDPRESIGLSWIKELENGRYFKEEYIAHIELRTEDLVSIVTDARVLMVRIKRLKVEWEIPFEDLQLVRVEGNSVSLIKAARQGQASSRIVPCSDPASAQWYCKRIEDAFAVHIDLNRPLD